MDLIRSEYDRGVNTFSPEGRLFQVGHPIETVKLGATSVGIHNKEGTLLAAQGRSMSRLVVGNSMSLEMEKHIAVASAGLIADARPISNPHVDMLYGVDEKITDLLRHL